MFCALYITISLLYRFVLLAQLEHKVRSIANGLMFAGAAEVAKIEERLGPGLASGAYLHRI